MTVHDSVVCCPGDGMLVREHSKKIGMNTAAVEGADIPNPSSVDNETPSKVHLVSRSGTVASIVV